MSIRWKVFFERYFAFARTIVPWIVFSATRRPRLAATILTFLLLNVPLRGDGIPEPSLVLYGTVIDTGTGNRVTFGTLTWSFRPTAGGSTITVSTTLTNINDQFSYVVRVPCETELTGVAVSPGVLKLASTATTYDRSQVKIHGTNATFVNSSLGTLTLGPTDRGLIQRVDFTVTLTLGTGMPDAWQMQYFNQVGVDPNADPDQDGATNLQEYRAGTHPLDAQSRFEFVSVEADPAGGVRIRWPSVAGKVYSIQRSLSLTTAFSDLQISIPATAPLNSYRDATAVGGGPFFYRLRVE